MANSKNFKTLQNLARDGSNAQIQEANSFDTTGSPLTLATGVNIITVPDNAAEFIVYPITNDLMVSEKDDMSTNDLVTKSNKEPFPCAGMQFIYIQGTMGDTVYTRFHEV